MATTTTRPSFRIEWMHGDHHWVANEPTDEEVIANSAALAAAYNDPHNAPLMGHTDAMSVDDVIEHYRDMRADGARQFLLFANGEFVGDADLRDIEHGHAEFAIMVASRATQGRGLGTRFALMINAFGFVQLGLHTIVVAVLPANVGSRRLFDKLGYVVDDSAMARAHADEDIDITMSTTRTAFEQRHAGELEQITFAKR